MKPIWLSFLAILVFLAVLVWGTDYFTLKGEWTIYTVGCEQGAWHGNECSGQLVSAERYRFRALRAHSEVLFWVSGSPQPSGKYTECVIVNGRNWACKPNADTSRTIAYKMVQGKPVREPGSATRSFHCVSKWRWWLIKYGIPTGRTVSS